MLDKLPPITYKYPKDSKDNPFDINSEGKFFINASGFTYLSQSLKPFLFQNSYHNKDIEEIIPMGYKTIIINERAVFVKNGKVIKAFEEEKLDVILQNFKHHKENQYVIYSKNKIYFEKYNTYLYEISKNGGWSFYDFVWDNKTDALDYAANYSKNDKMNNFLMICKVLESISWH